MTLLRLLKLRINRRCFWFGLGLLAAVTAVSAKAAPWLLNGGFMIPWLLLHGARMHDFGVRGLWAAAVVTAVLLGLVALATLPPPTVVYGPVGGLLLLALVGFSVWVGAKPGQPGANTFGAPPSGWKPGLPATL